MIYNSKYSLKAQNDPQVKISESLNITSDALLLQFIFIK